MLENFKKGHRDVQFSYAVIKDLEKDDLKGIEEALDQLTNVLCEVCLWDKAYAIMKVAMKDKKDNARLHEITARLAFIMEDFLKSIYHNKEASKLQHDACWHNYSDMGLAFYRQGLIDAGDADKSNDYFKKAMKTLDEALVQKPSYANAMVNKGLVYKHRR